MTKSSKNVFGVLTTSCDVNKFYKQQKNLCDDIINKYNLFYIIDLSNFLILKKKEKFNKIRLSKNFVYFKPKNFNEFKNFVKKDKLITFNNLDKGLNYFFINLMIKSLKIKLVLSFNLGSISMELIENTSLKSKILRLKKKFEEFFYKFFIFLKVFPQIDLYLHTDQKLVNKINYINKKRIKLPFKNLFNYTYIKKSVLISSRKNSFKIKRKYITFIDQNFYHPDRLLRDKKPSTIQEKNYFSNLNIFLKLIKKKFKNKICICLHPSSNIRLYKKYFSNKIIRVGNSEKIVAESLLVLAHISSLIIDSMNLSKPVIILKSYHLGDWMNKKCDEYINTYDLNNLNIDANEKFLMSKINKLDISKLIATKKRENIISNKQIIREMENIV